MGTIPLNSLCSVIPPDETSATQKNEWTFVLHSKLKSFSLTCKNQADCNRWIGAIQDVIDNSPIVETPMERLIGELKMASPEEVGQIYGTHKILTYSPSPLKTSLLPLPYGDIMTQSEGRTYETLSLEAVKISTSLLPSIDAGTEASPIASYRCFCCFLSVLWLSCCAFYVLVCCLFTHACSWPSSLWLTRRPNQPDQEHHASLL